MPNFSQLAVISGIVGSLVVWVIIAKRRAILRALRPPASTAPTHQTPEVSLNYSSAQGNPDGVDVAV